MPVTEKNEKNLFLTFPSIIFFQLSVPKDTHIKHFKFTNLSVWKPVNTSKPYIYTNEDACFVKCAREASHAYTHDWPCS